MLNTEQNSTKTNDKTQKFQSLWTLYYFLKTIKHQQNINENVHNR